MSRKKYMLTADADNDDTGNSPHNMNGDGDFQYLEIDNYDIYFWADVNNTKCAQLVRHIRNLEHDAKVHELEYGVKPQITLHINSYGGYVSSAMAVCDAIRIADVEIVTIVEGVAASAATLIALSGTKRKISMNSSYLIHQLSGMSWGTYSQMKDNIKHADMLMEQIVNMYVKTTNRTQKQIKAMLEHDYWMTPDTALEYGFVDEII